MIEKPPQQSRRLDGWKAIAGHFKRDRTTVMRWTQTRALPVQRVPGGGTGSVFAYEHELDQWLAQTMGDEDFIVDDAAQELAAAKPKRWLIPVFALATLALSGFAAAPYFRESAAPSTKADQLLPADPEVAALFVQARNDWASRTAGGLHKALAGYGTVISRDPKFVPAYVGLADAYLLIREYDAMSDAKAYPQAEAAAKAALAIEADNADAHRALAFVHFWWHLDNVATRAAMARSLAKDPRNAQTHFWYGNMLVSNGEAAAGIRELDIARLLNPGSKAIQADYGWALWTAGRRDEAKSVLARLVAEDPKQTSPHTYLAYIALAERDLRTYLEETGKRAALRADPATIAQHDAEQAAYDRGGDKALLRLMVEEAKTARDTSPVADSSWLAVIAAQAGDRATLVAVLKQADARKERWAFAGMTMPVFAGWKDDSEVSQLVKRRQGGSIQIDTSSL
jgi:Tfp pilus assembly protein PilF